MARCLIGCGSNLGQRREQLDRAVELLGFMPGVSVVAVSTFRETRPVGGPAAQSMFLNGVCLIETELAPRDLLGMLAAVEQTLHRTRGERWGKRTIDLDLLLYDEVVLDSADLVLPHPRMATRRFVLEPAAEIASQLAYPPAACTVGDLLANISVPHPLVVVVGTPDSGVAQVATTVGDALLARTLTAPAPLPSAETAAAADPAAWRRTLAAWAEDTAVERWDGGAPVTIADFWIEALPAAAAPHLSPEATARLEDDCERLAVGTVAPQVAILLIAPETRHPALQDRLARRLRCPGHRGPRTPKAVITLDASDLARAAEDATAAVEAML